MHTSGLQLLVQLLNVVSGLIFFYCLFSIPAQFIRRFFLRRQGKSVSPLFLIFTKLLKYWFVSAVIIIPFSLVIGFFALREGGLNDADIYEWLVTKAFIGNIGTSLLFGYVLMKANKKSWSYSAIEKQGISSMNSEE